MAEVSSEVLPSYNNLIQGIKGASWPGMESQRYTEELPRLSSWYYPMRPLMVYSTELTKLICSRTPVMDAFSYCVLNKWHVRMVTFTATDCKARITMQFEISDFFLLVERINSICISVNKKSRAEVAKKWFVSFPTYKERNGRKFIVTVNDTSKANLIRSINRVSYITGLTVDRCTYLETSTKRQLDCIDHVPESLGIHKRLRTQ